MVKGMEKKKRLRDLRLLNPEVLGEIHGTEVRVQRQQIQTPFPAAKM